MIAVAPVVAQSSRNFLEMNSMLCVSGQKKFCEDKPKIRKVIQDFQKWEKNLLHSKKTCPYNDFFIFQIC